MHVLEDTNMVSLSISYYWGMFPKRYFAYPDAGTWWMYPSTGGLEMIEMPFIEGVTIDHKWHDDRRDEW